MRQQIGPEVQQPRQRQPDDVEVVAVDGGHEGGSTALDRVAAGTALPLAGGDVPIERRAIEDAKLDHGHHDVLGHYLAMLGEGDAADDLVAAAGEAREQLAGMGGVARLAEHLTVEPDVGVGAEDQLALDGERLAAGVLQRERAGLARRLLLDARGPDVELQPQLLQDRPALGRGRR